MNPSQDYPSASVVILNFNGREFLGECLESLAKLRYPKDRLEVIMGDNASIDNSVDYVNHNFPWVKVVRFDKNYGFCKGNNLSAREAKGEYLVFLNNDTFVTEDWLSELVKGAVSEPGVLSCACKILCPQLGDGKVIQAAGGNIFASGGGFYEGWMDEDSERYNVRKYTGFGCGAGVLVEKKFFLETGGFDEYYFYSNEEMDLGFRVWLHGYKVLYVPTAVMYHYMGKTGFRGKGMTPSIEFLVNRNNVYFILKNFEWPTIIRGLFLFMMRTIFKVVYALFHANFQIPLALARAHYYVFKDFPKILRVRVTTQKSRKVSDRELVRRGVLATNWQAIRLFNEGAKRMKKYVTGSFYDTKDAVKVKIDKNGETTFYKP